jgi:hypothetical protein
MRVSKKVLRFKGFGPSKNLGLMGPCFRLVSFPGAIVLSRNLSGNLDGGKMASNSTWNNLLDKIGPAIGISVFVYTGSTLGFIIFGLFAGNINALSPSLETIARLSFALISLFVAKELIKGKNVLTLAGWPIAMTIFNFLVYPTGALAGTNPTWASLVELGSDGISGYQTLNLLINFSLIFSLILAVAFRKQILQQVAKGSLDAGVLEFWSGYKKRFLSSGIFTKLAGIFLIAWAVTGIVVLVSGMISGLVSLTNGSWDGLVSLGVAVAAIYLTLRSGWRWSRIAWLVGISAVWLFVLRGQVLYLSSPSSGLADLYFNPAIGVFVTVENLTMLLAVVSVVFVLAKSAVQAYATRVKSWIDKRMAELYEDDMGRKAPVEPRTTSLMAVFSLIFAFVFPFVGLILAHSARNDIAISRGTRYGTEMTIAAAVISWFFIIIYLVLILALVVFLPLLGLSLSTLGFLLGINF